VLLVIKSFLKRSICCPASVITHDPDPLIALQSFSDVVSFHDQRSGFMTSDRGEFQVLLR